MATTTIEQVRPGDVILPPAREVSLWMRRHLVEHGMSEAALHLTVTAVREGAPDKRGRWIVVTAEQSAEWNARKGAGRPLPFRFKARPNTPWSIIAKANGETG